MCAMHRDELIAEMSTFFIYFRPVRIEIPGDTLQSFFSGRSKALLICIAFTKKMRNLEKVLISNTFITGPYCE